MPTGDADAERRGGIAFLTVRGDMLEGSRSFIEVWTFLRRRHDSLPLQKNVGRVKDTAARRGAASR